MKQFLGINNVADPTRLKDGELLTAVNVDIGSTGDLSSRKGSTTLRAGAAHSVYEAPFGLLAVIDSDLVLLDTAGALLRVVYPSLGHTRCWYATLTDGRVAFSNGLIHGLTTAADTAEWGILPPVDHGEGIPGSTPYQITYVRQSDGLEGPPIYGPPIDTTQAIIGLPTKAGHDINIYFAPYGEAMFLAGSTGTDSYTHSGAPLGAQWVGAGLAPPPVGKLLHPWLSRVLIAEGKTLWATRPLQPELIDLTRDFIQFADDITLIYGTNSGVFVGTTAGVQWLDGTVFGDLKNQPIATGYVTLGSAVEFPLAYLNEKVRPGGILQGSLCLVDGVVHLIHGTGQITPLTAQRYRAARTEVHATVRMRDGVMQYLAAPA